MSEVYTVDIKHVDQSDDLCMAIPDELMETMGWEIGDDLKFTDHKDGSFGIKKVKYETVELDFDDEELFKYMQLAHDKNMSFNEFIEHALESAIEEHLSTKTTSLTGFPIGNDANFGDSME